MFGLGTTSRSTCCRGLVEPASAVAALIALPILFRQLGWWALAIR